MQRRYDRQIIIQRKTVTLSESGDTVETWADLVYNCLSFYAPTRGSERFASPEKVATQEVTFTVRFHEIPSASRPLGPLDRVIYPVDGISANVQSPPAGRVFDVLSSDVVGRNVDLSIKTLRRADAAT